MGRLSLVARQGDFISVMPNTSAFNKIPTGAGNTNFANLGTTLQTASSNPKVIGILGSAMVKMNVEDVSKIMKVMTDSGADAKFLSALPLGDAANLLKKIPDADAAAIIKKMPSDDAAAIMNKMPDADAEKILKELPTEDAVNLSKKMGRSYDINTKTLLGAAATAAAVTAALLIDAAEKKKKIQTCVNECLPSNYGELEYGNLDKSELAYKDVQDGKIICTEKIDNCNTYCKEECEEKYENDIIGSNLIESADSVFDKYFGKYVGNPFEALGKLWWIPLLIIGVIILAMLAWVAS
jgi:uncharacterized FlaG/YvyC family protein